MKKTIIFCFTLIMLFSQNVGYAAYFQKVIVFPEAAAKYYITTLAGTPAWLDRNNPFCKNTNFYYMENLEHVIIGNIDLNNEIVEIILDNGKKFYWEPSLTHQFKSLLHTNDLSTMAAEIQGMFYLNNPYEQHPDWSDETWQSIKSRNVYIGMTKQMCLMSWGQPEHVNRTTTGYGTSEQWVYKNDSYLYFDDGLLSTIQN